jgi:hypothetical protein
MCPARHLATASVQNVLPSPGRHKPLSPLQG